jgi:hypothetical protein
MWSYTHTSTPIYVFHGRSLLKQSDCFTFAANLIRIWTEIPNRDLNNRKCGAKHYTATSRTNCWCTLNLFDDYELVCGGGKKRSWSNLKLLSGDLDLPSETKGIRHLEQPQGRYSELWPSKYEEKCKLLHHGNKVQMACTNGESTAVQKFSLAQRNDNKRYDGPHSVHVTNVFNLSIKRDSSRVKTIRIRKSIMIPIIGQTLHEHVKLQ